MDVPASVRLGQWFFRTFPRSLPQLDLLHQRLFKRRNLFATFLTSFSLQTNNHRHHRLRRRRRLRIVQMVFFFCHSQLVARVSGEQRGVWKEKVIFGWITLEKRRHAARSGVRKRFFPVSIFPSFPPSFPGRQLKHTSDTVSCFILLGGKLSHCLATLFLARFVFPPSSGSIFPFSRSKCHYRINIYSFIYIFISSAAGSAVLEQHFWLNFFFFSSEWILIFIFYVFICLYRRLKFIWLLFTSSIWLHSDFSCCFIALEKFFFLEE